MSNREAIAPVESDIESTPFKYGFPAIPASLNDLKAKVSEGWAEILERLVNDLLRFGWNGEVLQIKEKFGGLRFYVDGATDEMWERICEATAESFRTCETCGTVGTVRHGGWKTLCDPCLERDEESKRF
jgi:hypothetical protein